MNYRDILWGMCGTHKRRAACAVGVVLILATAVHHASRHVSTGPDDGIELVGRIDEPATRRPTIRLGTFNIHGTKGRDGQRDITRVAQCLEALDFVALNEVHGPRIGQPKDQAALLGQRLGMASLFAPTVRVWYWRESGNGLLSRLPVTFWQRIPLPQRHDHSHRNAVLVGLKQGERTIRVLLTHINRRDPERDLQLRAVIALFTALETPSVLLGDLNTDAEDPRLGELLATPGVDDPVGRVLGDEAPRRIDWIITRGLDCVDAGVHKNDASDHPMVWAELR